MIFTITGYMGSGKTTICDILSREYNFRRVHAGGIFRQLGLEKNISVLDMTKELTAKGDSEVDRIIDQKMIEEFNNVKDNENVIFDSRLAWHFLDKSKTFNIFIVVSPYQAATRTYLTRKSEDESYDTLEEAIDALVERRVLENKRYKAIYGVNCEDLNNYDLVIDTSYINALEASEIIMDCYKKKTLNQPYERLWISPEFVFPTMSIDRINKEKVDGYLDRIYRHESLEQVELIRIHDALFIKDGHNRIVAYNLAKIRLFNPRIVLSEDDIDSEGHIVKKALSITEQDILDWENMNGFIYNYRPKIIQKMSRNNNANS
ncbi:MAG: AAA family ATPase [Bacilli bacterium]|nr:AAA family ATPase [Bacilli bacterium]